MTLATTPLLYEYITDLMKAADERDEARFEAEKEAAAREVTFDDVLEALADIPPEKKAYVMRALDTDRRHFAFQLENLFTDAIEKIAAKRAREAT